MLEFINGLVYRVYIRDDVDFVVRYEFLFDRFRAIRQDMIIQRLDTEDSVKILEIILAFYVISDYKYSLFIKTCNWFEFSIIFQNQDFVNQKTMMNT